jgi:hypothetical protein
MKLLRTIRLDPSDTFVFEAAAEPGEWAVPGGFMFWGQDIAALSGKRKAAFRSGFVGVASLGFSTLVVIQVARPDEVEAATTALARHLVDRFGAPDLDTAIKAARDEIAASASLAEAGEGTLVALHRLFEDGEIHEQFRTLTRREGTAGADSLHAQARAFTVHEVMDDGIDEEVDLVGLMARKQS